MKFLLAGLVIAEISMTIYTAKKLGLLDKAKDKVTDYADEIKSAYKEGRYGHA